MVEYFFFYDDLLHLYVYSNVTVIYVDFSGKNLNK